MTPERYQKILNFVHEYNTEAEGRNASPFIARHHGQLNTVAAMIGVPTKELDEFLTQLDRSLSQDHLVG